MKNIITFEEFLNEDMYSTDTYSGPRVVNTIANTLVASGSDGLIGGQINGGNMGGEFPKKYNPSTADPDTKYRQNIKSIKTKETKKRRDAIKKIQKINVMNFLDYVNREDSDK